MVRKLEETEAAGAPERHHDTSCHTGLDPHILEQSGGCGNKVVTLLPYSPLHLLQELSTLPPLTFGTECLVWGRDALALWSVNNIVFSHHYLMHPLVMCVFVWEHSYVHICVQVRMCV